MGEGILPRASGRRKERLMGRIGISHRMSRTKKPSKLSADERAFLNRIRGLNEEETEKLTFDELIAYFNIMHKIDPRSVRHALRKRLSTSD
jgi:hypothetical protein